MATNIKHTDSEKFQKALTLNDRISLDSIISTNRDSSGKLTITLNTISNMLEKDPTTLSKEVKKHRSTIDLSIPHLPYKLSYCRTCDNKRNCQLKSSNQGLQGFCENYTKFICPYLKKFPWVCNGCSKRGFCTSPKSYYSPAKAQNDYKLTLSDSRIGIYMSVENFNLINTTISDGISKGQSVEHILHSNNLGISTKSAYIYLNRGYFNAKPIDTHRMVRLNIKGYKRPYNSIMLKKEKEGRNYEDFRRLLEANPGMCYTQMDTIEGVKGGKVILSLKIVNIQFQFYFLLENKTAKCVVDKLNEIQRIIGLENYKRIFGIILTDNGAEFTDIKGIMTDPDSGEIRTELYFCQPLQSGQKGSCERNHELFRYILPKGTSFDSYAEETFRLITSHVNSYKRKSIDFSCPIEKFYAFFGKEILDLLNISLIPANEVQLTPELIK